MWKRGLFLIKIISIDKKKKKKDNTRECMSMFFRDVGPNGGELPCHSAGGNSWLSTWLNAGRQEMEHAGLKNAQRKSEGVLKNLHWISLQMALTLQQPSLNWKIQNFNITDQEQELWGSASLDFLSVKRYPAYYPQWGEGKCNIPVIQV